MARAQSNLYDQLIDLTSQLLGPASERFVQRQIANHLKKDPHTITPTDITKLSDWMRLALSILTDDPELVQSYMKDFNKLGRGHAAKQ